MEVRIGKSTYYAIASLSIYNKPHGRIVHKLISAATSIAERVGPSSSETKQHGAEIARWPERRTR